MLRGTKFQGALKALLCLGCVARAIGFEKPFAILGLSSVIWLACLLGRPGLACSLGWAQPGLVRWALVDLPLTTSAWLCCVRDLVSAWRVGLGLFGVAVLGPALCLAVFCCALLCWVSWAWLGLILPRLHAMASLGVCSAVLCMALPCCSVFSMALPCFAMLCHALPCFAMLCHALPRFAMLCRALCSVLSACCFVFCVGAWCLVP